MSTGKNIKTTVDSGSPVTTQNHSPDQSYYSLDAFYATLLSRTFKSSTEAITFCRDLCSSHGFTVKQEQSTHKNIYVYCSREGLPDSHRNPKVNPQRNRQSQRCECRWRIVLFENLKLTWEFRKSQNADAFIHNHPLLRPDEIKKEWPREVSEKIFELARHRLPTNEIRQQVREQYPDISWDDRRFYNRLSEERQKMKQRDTAMRTIRLVNLSAQICMVNAGSEDLSHYVESKLLSLLEDTCKFANVNSNSIAMPVPMPPFPNSGSATAAGTTTEERMSVTPTSQQSFSVQHEEDNRKRGTSSNIKAEFKQEIESSSINNNMSRKTSLGSIQQDDNDSTESKRASSSSSSINLKKSFETLPKGYLAVPIPEHTFHVKMYSQNSAGDIRRAIFDMQRPTTTNTAIPNPNMIGNNLHLQYVTQNREPRRRRSRALFAPEEDNDSMDLDSPARKLSRQVASSIIDDELDDMSSQSSPSNSQSLLFAAGGGPGALNHPSHHHTHDLNVDQHQQHHQLIGNNPYNRIPSNASTPTGTAATGQDNSLFYNGGGGGGNGAGNNVDTSSNSTGAGGNNNSMHNSNYLHQSPFSAHTTTTQTIGDSNIYPSVTASRHMQQHVIYDPNSFVHQQQQSTNNEINLMQQQHQHHTLNERPHSMTFGATVPTSLRAQSVSIPRATPIIDHHPSNIRPTGYPTNFVHLQSMIEDNDGKQRYYSAYKETLQQGQPSSPIPPRPASSPAAAAAAAAAAEIAAQQSSNQQQQMLPQQSQYLPQNDNSHMFPPPFQMNNNSSSSPSSSSSSHQQTQNVFPTPYITNEQILHQQQEQEKRKQQYNLNYQQQQFERQQQEQHLYRRASGPG